MNKFNFILLFLASVAFSTKANDKEECKGFWDPKVFDVVTGEFKGMCRTCEELRKNMEFHGAGSWIGQHMADKMKRGGCVN
jgi:hypothetical protein